MRSSVFFALLVLAGTGAVAACSSGSNSNGGDDDTEASDQDLTLLELKCTSSDHTTTFDVSPGFGGASLEGKLTATAGSTLFVCRPPAGMNDVVVQCNERPQEVHPGRWSVDITKTGMGYQAKIEKGDAGAAETMSCATPPRPDAGFGDAAAIPHYADVKPLILGKCGGCHAGTFDSLDKVRQKRVAMLSVISSGAMPRGSPGWRETADGKAVLDFLRNSPELE